ncbi:NADP-dependent 3-hydroxy acid dehydrogenase YdfG [Halobiforma haloterrestris]|uniref:NADP-dependent 3-hydroxy acid dehydrogenase YdfG n=1 Tax=Natronobacterium haloterrestre TaxID=148448 RepID=A0A1I1LB63_NATHA|nr:SDR family NAD(P)-dependent oxidoreductase [Halobiforma haloterrestris]SFC70259.1 NADP-dependent 3-hydroxy acid dehydrogenase YdfG [Halobiforma haloterrestris]
MHATLTGAGGGIGRLVATRLAEAGHDVLGLDRDPDRLDALPDAVETVRVDVRDEIAVRELLADRPIDCVISAVGWYELGALEDVSPAAFRRHLETNLTGVHTVVHAAMPTLRRREGRVVALGSVAGTVALPYHGPYSVAKAGLDGYVDALRREVSQHGVTVSLVEPGPARTGLNERATETLEDDRRRRGPYAEQYAAFDGYSPESVPPETVAETVVEAATTGSPRTRYRVGRRARWLPWLAAVLPDPLADRIIRSGLPGGLLGRLVDR